MSRKIGKFYNIALTFLFIVFSSSIAEGIENRGIFSIEDYYYKDETFGYKSHFLTSRLKLDTTKLDKEGRYAFHFDGSERVDLGSTNSSTVKNLRLNVLNVDYKGAKYYLSAGRLWPKQMGFELVDGVNAAYEITPEYGAGGFGGFKPDVYTTGFSSKYTTAGLYGFYLKESTTATVAYVYNGFNGGIDRQYVYGQANVGLSQTFNLYGTVTADISPGGSLSLTNGIAEITYRHDFNKSVFVGYNEFRSIKLYRSVVSTGETSQRGYYLGGSYRILDGYNLYGRAEVLSRQLSAEDKRTISSFQAGLNADNILNSAVNLNLSYNTLNGGGSTQSSYRTELSRMNWEVLELMLRLSYTQNKYEQSDPDNILLYGFSAYYYYSRAWNLSFNFDREMGETYSSNNILTRVSYRF